MMFPAEASSGCFWAGRCCYLCSWYPRLTCRAPLTYVALKTESPDVFSLSPLGQRLTEYSPGLPEAHEDPHHQALHEVPVGKDGASLSSNQPAGGGRNSPFLTLSPLEPMIPGKPLTPPGPWNYSAGGERRWQKGFALGCSSNFSRFKRRKWEDYFTGGP